jgi:hypothetical protein
MMSNSGRGDHAAAAQMVITWERLGCGDLNKTVVDERQQSVRNEPEKQITTKKRRGTIEYDLNAY